MTDRAGERRLRRFARGVACAAASLLLLAGAAPNRARAPEPFTADPYPSTYTAPAAAAVVIAGATILDGAGARIDGGDLVLAEGKVLAVGRGLARPTGATIIDGRGRWVTPGLIDVHTHLGTYTLPQTSADGEASDVTETSDPNAADTWIEHAVRPEDPGFSRALAGGVTTLQVLPGSSVLFGGRSVVLKPIPAVTVAAMKFPGAPQGLKMACGANPKETFGSKGRAPNSRQGEMALMRRAFLEAAAYRADWERYETGAADAPPPRDLKKDTLAAVLAGAMPVHVHCYRSDEMARMLDLAQEFGFHISAFHHALEAYKITDLLVHNRTCVVSWPDWWGFKPEAEDGIRETIALIDAAGGCATVHSDIPILGDHLNLEAAKAAAAGRRMGLALPPERVIRWLTSNPAGVLGLGRRIGRLVPGYDADVVVWSGDPFSVYTHVDAVFLDGVRVYDRSAPARPSDFELGRGVLEGGR